MFVLFNESREIDLIKCRNVLKRKIYVTFSVAAMLQAINTHLYTSQSEKMFKPICIVLIKQSVAKLNRKLK